jgi:hypothetical protein
MVRQLHLCGGVVGGLKAAFSADWLQGALVGIVVDLP